MEAIRSLLATVDALAGLEPALLDRVARMARRRTVVQGETVFWEGEPCRGLYLVESGWLRASKVAPNGREQVMRVVGEGEAFNELSILSGTPNQATVSALEPSVLWLVPREALLDLMDQEAALARAIAQNLARRVLYLVSLVEDLSLRTVEARLARFLVEQASAGVVTRQSWATLAELAARLGTVPDVLGRALRRLAEAGLIEVERQRITLLDEAGLQRRAEDP